jgi:hypothetical protein
MNIEKKKKQIAEKKKKRAEERERGDRDRDRDRGRRGERRGGRKTIFHSLLASLRVCLCMYVSKGLAATCRPFFVIYYFCYN